MNELYSQLDQNIEKAGQAQFDVIALSQKLMTMKLDTNVLVVI